MQEVPPEEKRAEAGAVCGLCFDGDDREKVEALPIGGSCHIAKPEATVVHCTFCVVY